MPINYIRTIPTKATYCANAALETTYFVLENSSKGNEKYLTYMKSPFGQWLKSFIEKPSDSLVIPEEVRFSGFERDPQFFEDARNYAIRHGLPAEIADPLSQRFVRQGAGKRLKMALR